MTTSELAYSVWLDVIADESLYEATLAGTHHELASSRELDEATIGVLSELHAQPGFRWMVENLRFRSAMTAADVLNAYLRRTMAILSENRAMWLQEISFEYLAYHRWQAYGFELAEVRRFASYVRSRIMKRRIVPRYLEAVLDFELAMVDLIASTKSIATSAWPLPWQPVSDDALLSLWPRWGPAVSLIECEFDVGELKFGPAGIERPEVVSIHTGESPLGDPQPTSFLLYISSIKSPVHHQKMSDGALLVFEGCAGEQRVGDVVSAIAEEFGASTGPMLALVKRWLAAGVLTAAA